MLALLLSACLPPILLDTGFVPDTGDTDGVATTEVTVE